MYLSNPFQTLQRFPQAWYSQGHFISSTPKAAGPTEGSGGGVPVPSDPARPPDDRTGTVHIQGRGTVATYMFEERANVCRYFEPQSGLWLLLPLQWEMNMDFTKERLQRVMAALPGLLDQTEILAALRQCSYDPEEVISVYLSVFGEQLLQRPAAAAAAAAGGEQRRAELHSLRALQDTEREVQDLRQRLHLQQQEARSVSQKKDSLTREVRYLSDVVQVLNRQLAQLEAEHHDARRKIRSLLAPRPTPPPPPPPPAAAAAAAAAAPPLDPAQLLRLHGQTRELRVGSRTLASAVRHLLGEAGEVLGEVGAAVGRLGRRAEAAAADLEEARALYRKEAVERRSLYNRLQEAQGNVRVMCRCRGGGASGCRGGGASGCLELPSDQEVLLLLRGTRRRFHFDKVFPPGASQEAVFAGTLPLITSCVDGYNVCILAYGQTGSGKSYTMTGTRDQPGVNVRSIQELLHMCTEQQSISYSLKVSMLEIYNDSLNDLLAKKNRTAPPLEIRAQGRGVSVPGLTQVPVQTQDDIIIAMETGEKNRKIASTKMNIESSRSHLVLTLTVEGVDRVSGVTSLGTLTLCDLAGSERISKTEAKGERLVEAAAINKSLTALGQVFSALRCNALHVPFRNSKLTHLLQPCLSGDAKCCVLVTLSPDPGDLAETLSTLQYGASIQQVALGKAARNPAPAKRNP
ncbi:unnamed protein product [Merluccius merluccius]